MSKQTSFSIGKIEARIKQRAGESGNIRRAVVYLLAVRWGADAALLSAISGYEFDDVWKALQKLNEEGLLEANTLTREFAEGFLGDDKELIDEVFADFEDPVSGSTQSPPQATPFNIEKLTLSELQQEVVRRGIDRKTYTQMSPMERKIYSRRNILARREALLESDALTHTELKNAESSIDQAINDIRYEIGRLNDAFERVIKLQMVLSERANSEVAA